ncbi:hypothetical protein EMCRGX_G007939 [Ephydatia muelleri]
MTEKDEDLSYELVGDDDLDEFVSVDVPSDSCAVSPAVPLGKKSRASSRKKVPQASTGSKAQMDNTQDISQVNLDDPAPVSLVPRLSGGSMSLNSEQNLPPDMLLPSESVQVQQQELGTSWSEEATGEGLQLTADEETAKEATRCRVGSVRTDERKVEEEGKCPLETGIILSVVLPYVDSAVWIQRKKHVFIISFSGKPIYSRYGQEDKLVNLFGIMQALISFVQDDKDVLRYVVAGNHHFVFLCKGPLMLVTVSRTRQSEAQLTTQLNYAYYQILSVLTNTQLVHIFDRDPRFDMRSLLQGSEKFIDNVLKMCDEDPSLLLGGIHCLPMVPTLRQTITTILQQCRVKDVLFIILIAKNQVITYVRPKEYNLHFIDIHLIINLVDASTSFKTAVNWTPICLPRFNETGFLHAHVSFLPDDSPACLLLVSTDKEKFFALQECQEKILERLEKQGCLGAIKQAVNEADYNIDHLQSPEVRHFVYKFKKTSSMTWPAVPSMYTMPKDVHMDRLFELYMLMQQKLYSDAWPIKIYYHLGNSEAIMAWKTAEFDLYIVFDPLIAKMQAITLGNKLIRWIRKDEERLVIPTVNFF